MEQFNQGERCQKCGEIGSDRRSLWMACFYDMNELGILFDKEELSKIIKKNEGFPEEMQVKIPFFTLRVCKKCRAEWMDVVKQWYNNVTKKESCGSGIFIRYNGATIEITREEFDKLYPGGGLVIFKKEKE